MESSVEPFLPAPGFTRKHTWIGDWAPTALIFLLSGPGLGHDHTNVALGVAGNAALVLPLVLRRRYPIGTFAVVVAISVGLWAGDVKVFGFVALLVAFYAVTASRPRRTGIMAAAVVELCVVLFVARWAHAEGWVVSLILASGTVCAAGVLGAYTRTRAAYLQQLHERASRLESERGQQVRLAAAAERSRIAREMHDIVAHHLTVMVALSDGAAATVAQSPSQAAQVMAVVSATGRQALADTRRLLGVLRDDVEGEAFAPQRDLRALEAVLEQVRSAGLRVDFSSTGTRVSLPAALELTAYRLVQEALTNVLKHSGPGTHVRLGLRFQAGQLGIDVFDDGSGADLLVGHSPGLVGHGLTGMGERVAAWDGRLEYGPLASGGWRTSATLHWDAASLESSPTLQSADLGAQ